MAERSAFEIIGPIMVGPSSSHTAGSLRIARLASSLASAPIQSVDFILYNSFARTYEGHGTDRALIGGMLGMDPDDERIKDAFNLAKRTGLDYRFIPSEEGEGKHPNTVDIVMHTTDGATTTVTGESLGGGRAHLTRINGIEIDLTGEYHTLFITHLDVPGVLAQLLGILAADNVNVAFMRSYRTARGSVAYTVFETDEPIDSSTMESIQAAGTVSNASTISIPGAALTAPGTTPSFTFTSGTQLLALCEKKHCSIGEVMYHREVELSGESYVEKMLDRTLSVMRTETTKAIHKPEISMGGYIGGEAHALNANLGTPNDLAGGMLSLAMVYATAVLEHSATMGVIVAAPTAGSSGVIPGSLLAYAKLRNTSDEELHKAIMCTAAVGLIIEHNATVSGAEGGCQAEVGSAAAMAAAALVELSGGTPAQALQAASITINNLLGLVCDPVKGLVEAPCLNRNVIGVSAAITSAQMALVNICCPAPFDEVVGVMKRVGDSLPPSLRETAMGGLAVAPSLAGGARPSCSSCGLCG